MVEDPFNPQVAAKNAKIGDSHRHRSMWVRVKLAF